MESVGNIIDVCFAAGANTLNGISFSASDTEEAKTDAMQKAVADARKKAEVLAEASGMKITSIEIITEGGVYSYENNVGNVYAAKGFDTVETEEDAGTVVQSAKLIVSYRAELPGDASLTVEFFLSFLAQFPLGDKSGHEHHLPSDGAGGFYRFLRFFSMSVVGCERRGTPGNLAFPAKIRWD